MKIAVAVTDLCAIDQQVQKTKLRPKKELTAQEKALRRMKEKRNGRSNTSFLPHLASLTRDA